MNKLITSACCLLFAGCATVSPVQRRAEQMRVAEVDFQNSEIADAIVFLVEVVNTPDPPRRSLGIIKEHDSAIEEDKRMRNADLYRLCEDKTISIITPPCSVLKLLEFITSCVNLDVEFRDDRLVIVSNDGKVIMK